MTFDLASAKLKAAAIPCRKPKPDEEKHVRNGLAFLVAKAPFFAHLLYHEMDLKYTDSPMITTMATDGKSIFINPAFAATLSIQEVAFVLAHEVAHGFLGDLLLSQKWVDDGFVFCPGGQLEYIHQGMNAAEDYRINGMLIEAKVGKMPEVGLYERTISEKGMESSVEIYEQLYRKAKNGGFGSGKCGVGMPGDPSSGGGNQGKGGFDVHLAPSREAVKEADSGRREQSVVAAAEAAKASGQGILPSYIQQLIGDILDPKVNWKDKLRSSCLRKGGDPLYDWRYLDRRLIGRDPPMFFAKQAHSGAGTIVIAGDTSGSMWGAMPEIFAEMNGICTDLNPQQIIVMWCDAEVHRVDDLDEPDDMLEYKDMLDELGGPGGGGGTSFVPVFEKIREMGIQPDMLVYLTDTYGTFPSEEPDYPVIWASTGGKRVPFGELIMVEVEG